MKYLSSGVGLENVDDHFTDGVRFREEHHRNIDCKLLENLTFELGECNGVSTAGCQRFVSFCKSQLVRSTLEKFKQTYRASRWAATPSQHEGGPRPSS